RSNEATPLSSQATASASIMQEACQRLADQREAAGDLRAMTRKPLCLISCTHWLPDGSLSVLVGSHGAMNPAGRVRCNMRNQIRLANHNCNFTGSKPVFLLGSSQS